MDLVQKIYERQMEEDPRLNQDLDDRRKRLMIKDIHYNFDNLIAAATHQSSNILIGHVRWLIGLLAYRMDDFSLERIKGFMKVHYRIMINAVKESEPSFESVLAPFEHEVEKCIETFELTSFSYLDGIRLENYSRKYLEALLNRDRKKAWQWVKGALDAGVTLEGIYLELFSPVMHEIGRLWHQNQIGIDKEHYATAVTQGVMSQLYSKIFATQKTGKTMVGMSVGNELHEMGIRMLCDLFEINGWDTIYLGAAVPQESLINSLEEYKPDLIALSVTMPNHLNECKATIQAIKTDERFQHVKIAVGGTAVEMDKTLREKWQVDVMANTFEELKKWWLDNE
jgi:methanogenic corrinoid protein MtbC1